MKRWVGALVQLLCVLGMPGEHVSFGGETYPILAKLRNTYYYSASEDEHPLKPQDAKILDLRGHVIANVNSRFKKAVDIEGTGLLHDGRVINFAGVKNGQIRYHLTRHPYGHGAGDCELMPFHTVAIDPSVIPLGSLVQIDETIGMKLPDGAIHNGLWLAEDVGGAIQKDRVDLFIARKSDAIYLDDAGITHLQALTVRLVSPPAEKSCIHQSPQ